MNKALIIISILISFLFGYIVTDQIIKPTKKEVPASIYKLHQIDTIIVDREHYILETVVKKEKEIITETETNTVVVDNTFKNGSDSDKINLFNSKYPAPDTTKLMVITDKQAESAILEKINHARDSSLMVLYKNSADDCDIRLSIIKDKVDSAKTLAASDIDSSYVEGLKKGSTITALILSGLGLLYILTR